MFITRMIGKTLVSLVLVGGALTIYKRIKNKKKNNDQKIKVKLNKSIILVSYISNSRELASIIINNY